MRDGPGLLGRKPGDVILPVDEEIYPEILDPVISWRYECLENAGLGPDRAFLLAMDRSVDLHRAVMTVRNGGPELAWDIFS